MRLARRLRQQAATDATPSMLSALSSLDLAGPLRLGDLASLEQVRPPSMTRIVARLEEEGLVERAPDPGDRRSALMSLTRAGRDLIARNRTRKDAYLAHRIRSLDPGDIEALGAALPALERLLQTEDE